jgi:hypothetical protein
MHLIFDDFPNLKKARAFQEHAKEYGFDGEVFSNAREADKHAPFYLVLKPPIVHIECDLALNGRHPIETKAFVAKRQTAAESNVIELVNDFGGNFAGTTDPDEAFISAVMCARAELGAVRDADAVNKRTLSATLEIANMLIEAVEKYRASSEKPARRVKKSNAK